MTNLHQDILRGIKIYLRSCWIWYRNNLIFYIFWTGFRFIYLLLIFTNSPFGLIFCDGLRSLKCMALFINSLTSFLIVLIFSFILFLSNDFAVLYFYLRFWLILIIRIHRLLFVNIYNRIVYLFQICEWSLKFLIDTILKNEFYTCRP
jgi:hypothetical protein